MQLVGDAVVTVRRRCWRRCRKCFTTAVQHGTATLDTRTHRKLQCGHILLVFITIWAVDNRMRFADRCRVSAEHSHTRATTRSTISYPHQCYYNNHHKLKCVPHHRPRQVDRVNRVCRSQRNYLHCFHFFSELICLPS